MISLTKVFRFEAAHALYGYEGACARIHGHSYELRIRIGARKDIQDYMGDTGMILDLKVLKRIVKENVLSELDHKILLSEKYIHEKKFRPSPDELVIFPAEPTVENMLLYIKNKVEPSLPENVQLLSVKLYETRDSMAAWERDE